MGCLRGKAVLGVIGVNTKRPADSQMLVVFMMSELTNSVTGAKNKGSRRLRRSG
jgi:hypothetical protein